MGETIEKNIFNMKLFVALLVAAGAQKFDPCQKSCGAEFRKCSRSAQVKKLNSDFTSCLSESVECFSHCPRPEREDDCFFCYSDVWKCQMQCHREAEKSENPEKFCMARCNASALNCLDKC